MITVIVRDRAIADVIEHIKFYDTINPKLGDKFQSEFDVIVDLIRDYPFSGWITGKKFRQMRMTGFPYLVLYKVIRNEAIVVSVVHFKRHPRRKFYRTT